MRDRPDGARLLELARETLLEALSAALPPDGRYTARLVANAMAIAARELETGDAPCRAERAALEKLFGEDREEAAGLARAESLEEALHRLRWRLAAEIRAGVRDADPGVHALLRESAAARLKIVNPRALGSDGAGGA